MATSFGLYFGNTNLCLAINKDGKIDTLANDAGDRVTPAMVSFVNGENCVGLPAKQRILRFPSSVVKHLKRNIELIQSSFEKQEFLKHKIEDGDEVKFLTTEELLILLFKKMHSVAMHCNRSNNSYPTVLTVPLHFTLEQKAVVRMCAEKAGFEILRLVSEPAASALAYDIGQNVDSLMRNCLVYRIGATSLDVSIVQSIGGIYRIVSQVRRTDLGGDVFTKQLVDFCTQEFQRQHKVDVKDNKKAMAKLWSVAEQCKHGLSMVSTALFCAESLYDGIDLNINISRARYESQIGQVVQECLQPIAEALNKASLTEGEIHYVVLAGGCTKVVLLQQLLRNDFKTAEILSYHSPDEVTAIGAAKQAAMIRGGEVEETVEAVAKTIFIKAVDDNSKAAFLPVILKGTPVPTKWHQKLTLPENQTSFLIDVYEGVANKEGIVEQPVQLAKVVMKDIPAGSDVPVTLQIKTDGNLYISCQEKTLNKVECVTVHQAVRCS